MAMHIKSDGTIIPVKPENGKNFSLDELNKFVGGYMEIVRLQAGHVGLIEVKPGDLMIVNDNGLRLELPLNRTATAMYWLGRNSVDPVVGDVLLCKNSQVR